MMILLLSRLGKAIQNQRYDKLSPSMELPHDTPNQNAERNTIQMTYSSITQPNFVSNAEERYGSTTFQNQRGTRKFCPQLIIKFGDSELHKENLTFWMFIVHIS